MYLMYNNRKIFILSTNWAVCPYRIYTRCTSCMLTMHTECIDRMATVTHVIGYPVYRMYTKLSHEYCVCLIYTNFITCMRIIYIAPYETPHGIYLTGSFTILTPLSIRHVTHPK